MPLTLAAEKRRETGVNLNRPGVSWFLRTFDPQHSLALDLNGFNAALDRDQPG
jgi:hypothetical protein